MLYFLQPFAVRGATKHTAFVRCLENAGKQGKQGGVGGSGDAVSSISSVKVLRWQLM